MPEKLALAPCNVPEKLPVPLTFNLYPLSVVVPTSTLPPVGFKAKGVAPVP